MAKIVFITGGSSGIGKAIGDYLSNRNYKVYGTSRNPDRISDSSFSLLKMDVTDADSIERAVSLIVEKHGKIDVLINNAGVGITGPIEETPNEEILSAFATNFLGPINEIGRA